MKTVYFAFFFAFLGSDQDLEYTVARESTNVPCADVFIIKLAAEGSRTPALVGAAWRSYGGIIHLGPLSFGDNFAVRVDA